MPMIVMMMMMITMTTRNMKMMMTGISSAGFVSWGCSVNLIQNNLNRYIRGK